jgi:hypothetical protein
VRLTATVEELTRPLTPFAKLRLAGEVVAAYVRVRWALSRGMSVPEAVEMLRAAAPGPDAQLPADSTAKAAGLRLGRAVGRTLGALPADAHCLTRSLVLTALLARRGIPSSLVIGVSPEPDFEAHAWIESRGTPLLPPDQGKFARLVEI